MNVCRYVEANPLCAGLVDHAEDWRWSSLVTNGPADGVNILAEWPFRRPRQWLQEVNRPQNDKTQRELKRRLGRPSKTAHALVAIAQKRAG